MKHRGILLCSALLLVSLSACGADPVPTATPAPAITPPPSGETAHTPVAPYSDIRYFEHSGTQKSYEEGEYNRDDIVTYTFNQDTVLVGSEDLQAQIMERGKNPGLGIRALHERGVTGKDVNVAIIDQNLLLNHPEFAGKIAAYYDTGCGTEENSGSMHAPAVTSILVGDSIGVAPDARV